jgi:predicted deacylase
VRRLLGALLPFALAATLAIPLAQPAQAAHAGRAANERRVIATSVEGRPIVARHYGALDAPVQIVVIGQMHGNEPGGLSVARELSAMAIPAGVGLWLIPTVNPDGGHRHRRSNAHGVDLNRNFPQQWQRTGWGGPFWTGTRAASEPETRGLLRFLTSVRPTAVLSFHQAYDVVDISHPRSRPAGRRLADWMGERAAVVPCQGPCHGTMTQWVDRALRAIAITVELDGHVSKGEARRAATAVLRLGRWLGR